MNRAARISEAWGLPPSSRAAHRAPAAEAVSLSASAAFCHFTESRGLGLSPAGAPAGCACDEIPASNPVAKTSEDNGRTSGAEVAPMPGEASRPHGADHAGGTPPHIRRDGAERRAPNSQSAAHPAVTAPAFNPKAAHAGAVVLSDAAMILLHAVAAYERCDAGRAVTLALATHVKRIGCGPLARAALDELERSHFTHKLAERVVGGAGGVDAGPAGALSGEDLTDLPPFTRQANNRFVLTPKAPDGAFAKANDARSGLRPRADTRSGGP